MIRDSWGRRCGLHGEVGAVGDQLGVNSVNGVERAFELRGGVVGGLQGADGGVDYFAEAGDVCGGGWAEEEVHFVGVLFDGGNCNWISVVGEQVFKNVLHYVPRPQNAAAKKKRAACVRNDRQRRASP